MVDPVKKPYWGCFYLKTAKPFFTAAVTEDDVDIICEGLAGVPSGRILDLGCGHGRHIPGVCDGLKRNITGIDLDVTSLNEARAAGCDVVHADICDLPYEDETIAGAYCFANTAFCFSPKIRQRMLREVARVLARGGKFITQSLPPAVAQACGDIGAHSETLEDGAIVEDNYTWNGEKLHIVRTWSKDDETEESEISIYCPSDAELIAEAKKFGLEVLRLKNVGLQRLVISSKP